ncbi:hypothetical protein [Bacillus sp. P14.5]|uniref:hypothetical protein n=1 Tax=Bacillus sp. P14.5 TaxID=1983400 RepID=UPI000DE906B7|nr:hypothetical protein [Bacillus sp. P14.5]
MPKELIGKSPKIKGNYKKQGWAIKVLEKIENPSIEVEEEGIVTAKAILLSNIGTYYPAFLTISIKERGRIIGMYFIVENTDAYSLIPFELSEKFIDHSDLLPLKYKTLEKIEKDEQQNKWPDYS